MLENLAKAEKRLDVRQGEHLWFRGVPDRTHTLSPSLMRMTENLKQRDHDGIEQNLFFEFQAKAAELRARGLSDWEYLFYGRHYGVPTRVLDWTDTFGVALYFAVENVIGDLATTVVNGARKKPTFPTIWILNPYALNYRTWGYRDIILPKYISLNEKTGRYRDFGELLAASGDWHWDAPVAIYPAQINDRVRAQRGWFTIHGQSRAPLEAQAPQHLVKLVLQPDCVDDALELLELFGLHRFSIYPDLDNLALWLRQENLAVVKATNSRTSIRGKRKRAATSRPSP